MTRCSMSSFVKQYWYQTGVHRTEISNRTDRIDSTAQDYAIPGPQTCREESCRKAGDLGGNLRRTKGLRI